MKYLEKEFPELLCILGEKDREIDNLNGELDQVYVRLDHLVWLTKKQEDQLKVFYKIFFGVILLIIILLIIYDRF